ncbi:S1 family serine peptidase [Bdellovibrio svalbardensis]|uniref:Serine protease n=1 Tax=Bdellovibrio svalbardensis TaxID=2972972 RepID=A0ABT6DJ95_9BACT|nr:serine protease [Bdellovibrio svalbardensis]MDG0816929.1 serine protease [Bdellovibrio svalbardensis]
MKVLNHLFVAGLIVAASVSAQADKVVGKIVGGTEAAINEFPYIVSLQSSSHFCGGSLIKKNWVLTAAHCVKGGSVKNVVIGLHDLKNTTNAEKIAPKRIIAHPQYNASATDYDFALIELSRDSSFTPIALNTTEIAISDSGAPIMSTVAGWGTTTEGSYSLPNLLQRVDVPLVSQAACNKSYPNKITDRMICAGYTEGGKDSCQGDSGGPLVAKADDGQTYLIGVVSWGRGCARAGYPGVYSKVNAGYDWIMANAQ